MIRQIQIISLKPLKMVLCFSRDGVPLKLIYKKLAALQFRSRDCLSLVLFEPSQGWYCSSMEDTKTPPLKVNDITNWSINHLTNYLFIDRNLLHKLFIDRNLLQGLILYQFLGVSWKKNIFTFSHFKLYLFKVLGILWNSCRFTNWTSNDWTSNDQHDWTSKGWTSNDQHEWTSNDWTSNDQHDWTSKGWTSYDSTSNLKIEQDSVIFLML